MQFLESLSAIADDFDAVLLDLWGVIHDGTALYPGALDAVKELHARGKFIIFLSNAPRRAEKARITLDQLGVERRLYSALLTSGEAGFYALAHGVLNLGTRYFYIGPQKDADVLEGLDMRAVGMEDAQFVLNVGFGSEEQGMEDWDDILRQALHRKLPMLCLNPDLEVVKITGERFPCAGVLAKAYYERGGNVVYYGKPYPDVYKVALKMMGDIEPSRVLGIGDGLHTDVMGARGAGLKPVLVTGGILRQVLGDVDEAEMRRYLEAQDVQPDYIISGLRW